MLFNSTEFAFFLPFVFVLYWFVFNKNLRLQNILIIVASYTFYCWWDYRFLSLIIISTLVDFFVGIGLSSQNNKFRRKALLMISIFVNLGILGFFKYYNFFLDNFIKAFSSLGFHLNAHTLKIILPVGISFYTFQTLSYSIDVYRDKLKPTKNIVAFAAFVSFFPQLVAGPIERATNLLPQFYSKRKFDYELAVDGMRQILWGLFKKIVIADNCAEFANNIFNHYNNYSGSTLLLGALFFTFQIYGDFSGYSDIAIGTSRLFGFNLMQNFAFPYFSRDIAEFWRRWHISLSTWFRDYLYIPLGGSRGKNINKIRNTFVIFIVSGFWHGANWTFIVWGTLNAFYFLPLLIANKNRKNLSVASEGKIIPEFKEGLAIFKTFIITVFTWIFFRSQNLSDAFQFISKIFSRSILTIPQIKADSTIILIIILMIIEWLGREKLHALQDIQNNIQKPLRWLFYILIICCLYFFNGKQQEFIYFQF